MRIAARDYTSWLAAHLQARGVSQDRIDAEVSRLDDELADTGTHPRLTYGSPRAYARVLSPRSRFRPGVCLPTAALAAASLTACVAALSAAVSGDGGEWFWTRLAVVAMACLLGFYLWTAPAPRNPETGKRFTQPSGTVMPLMVFAAAVAGLVIAVSLAR